MMYNQECNNIKKTPKLRKENPGLGSRFYQDTVEEWRVNQVKHSGNSKQDEDKISGQC